MFVKLVTRCFVWDMVDHVMSNPWLLSKKHQHSTFTLRSKRPLSICFLLLPGFFTNGFTCFCCWISSSSSQLEPFWHQLLLHQLMDFNCKQPSHNLPLLATFKALASASSNHRGNRGKTPWAAALQAAKRLKSLMTLVQMTCWFKSLSCLKFYLKKSNPWVFLVILILKQPSRCDSLPLV